MTIQDHLNQELNKANMSIQNSQMLAELNPWAFSGHYDPPVQMPIVTTVFGSAELNYFKCCIESPLPKNKRYLTNCPNCGAPLKSHKCEYCGSEFD